MDNFHGNITFIVIFYLNQTVWFITRTSFFIKEFKINCHNMFSTIDLWWTYETHYFLLETSITSPKCFLPCFFTEVPIFGDRCPFYLTMASFGLPARAPHGLNLSELSSELSLFFFYCHLAFALKGWNRSQWGPGVWWSQQEGGDQTLFGCHICGWLNQEQT